MSAGVLQWSVFSGLYVVVLSLNVYQVVGIEPQFKDVGLLNWIFHRLIIAGTILWLPGSIVLANAFTDDLLNFVGLMLLYVGSFVIVLSLLVVIFQTWKNAKMKVDKNEEFAWKLVLGILFIILVVSTPTFLALFYATDKPIYGAFPDFVFTGVLVASVICWWILFLDLELYLSKAKAALGASKSSNASPPDPLVSLRRLIIGMTLLVIFGGTIRIYMVAMLLQNDTHFRGQQDASQFNAIPILSLIWAAACTYTFWKTVDSTDSNLGSSELGASGSSNQRRFRSPTLDTRQKQPSLMNASMFKCPPTSDGSFRATKTKDIELTFQPRKLTTISVSDDAV